MFALRQHTAAPTRKTMDKADSIALIVAGDEGTRRLADVPYGELLRARLQGRRTKLEACKVFATELPTERGTRVALALASGGASSYERLSLARKIAARLLEPDPRTVHVVCVGLDAQAASAHVEAVCSALAAACFALPSEKREATTSNRLRTVHLYGLGGRLDRARLVAEAEGNALARRLTALPGNHLTPRAYRQELARLAKTHGWRLEHLDRAALRRKKAGAFLAVTQAGAEADAGIARLRYRPRGARRRIALVGKGLCFDTGGVNLKSARHMQHMHEDMGGSAVALGVLLALTRLGAPIAVDCWLALAQNLVGPGAYKPGDVVRACNGTSIEVVHTDAEGRMVLADTLALAGRERPGLIVDFATLTGACIYALGTRFSGIFTNREHLHPLLTEVGRTSGERVWPFPTDEDFDRELKSEVADIKQCTLEGEADHILAARFLSRFVPAGIPWLHLDLAAARSRGGLAHIPSEVTGFGVRYTLALLLDSGLFEQLQG